MTWRIWWTLNSARKWHMKFSSAFQVLKHHNSHRSVWLHTLSSFHTDNGDGTLPRMAYVVLHNSYCSSWPIKWHAGWFLYSTVNMLCGNLKRLLTDLSFFLDHVSHCRNCKIYWHSCSLFIIKNYGFRFIVRNNSLFALFVPQYGNLTFRTCIYQFLYKATQMFVVQFLPISSHMLQCSSAHTLSCLCMYCSFTNIGHADMICSTVTSNCLQSTFTLCFCL